MLLQDPTSFKFSQQQTAKLLDVESIRTDVAMSVNKTLMRMEKIIRIRFSRAEELVKRFSNNGLLHDDMWEIRENDLTEKGLTPSEAKIFLKDDCVWLDDFL